MAGHGPIEADALRAGQGASHFVERNPIFSKLGRMAGVFDRDKVVQSGVVVVAGISLPYRMVDSCVPSHAPAERERPPDPEGFGGRRVRSGQTRPSFSRPVQQVSVIRRVTTYGSTLAFGRRSSM
ncbi:hypothetical protein GCM10009731_65480 [Streptomyces globosus]